LLVDGRYVTQARGQVDQKLVEVVQSQDPFEIEAARWLARYTRAGDRLGFDPWLHSIDQIDAMTKGLDDEGVRLKSISRNLIDIAWGKERPAPPNAPIEIHDLSHAGCSVADKIASVQSELKSKGDAALLVTQADNVSWLFNVRGSDVPHTPVVLAFAIVPAKGKPELFMDADRLQPEVRSHLERHAVLIAPAALRQRLKHSASASEASGATLRIDPKYAAVWFQAACRKTARSINRTSDPITALKARKNAVEIEGARASHHRDAIAMCRFLSWLDRTFPGGRLDEITVAQRLEEFRRDTGALRDISFDTIVGSGPNGAIVHYRVNTASNRLIVPGDLLLIDSGGQYRDGTTDITRTIAVGAPTPEMRRNFTLVLKGHLALSMARFPKGTRGLDLDPLARVHLWAHGLDYDHGTGHGVGSFLSVHEGPQSISRRGIAALEPGMICSNEPGFYRPGAYGIRIETLCLVEVAKPIEGGDRDMMSFETLTLVPIDTTLIQRDMLTSPERAWLNTYHARIRSTILPHLDQSDAAWLDRSTALI
jgi:Xaa-Pro aminopeptidase